MNYYSNTLSGSFCSILIGLSLGISFVLKFVSVVVLDLDFVLVERMRVLVEGEREGDAGDIDPIEPCFAFFLNLFFFGFCLPHSSTSFDASLKQESKCFL